METIITKRNSGGFRIIDSQETEFEFDTTFYSDGNKINEFLKSLKNGDQILLVLKKLSKNKITRYMVVKKL